MQKPNAVDPAAISIHHGAGSAPRLMLQRAETRASLNREPFGFTQNLHTLDLFQPASLHELCRTYSTAKCGYFVAAGAPEPGTSFYEVPHGGFTPSEALELLEERPLRILLKRPEEQDLRFAELLSDLFAQVMEARGGLPGERVVRLESAVLITSASTITPLHFDPEMGFFSQIEGEKNYHVYSPKDASEREMERFYIRGVVDIAVLRMADRHAAYEHVFYLRPGFGLHQPQNAPHWVETVGGRSVSYTFVFETDKSRALGRTRAFNHYQRKLRLPPSMPGMHPKVDQWKATVAQAVIPVRQTVGEMLRRTGVRA